jgi:hypothetical protein
MALLTITFYILKLVNPFKMAILLLLSSILTSLFLSFKTGSLWAASIVLLIFSRGIMILFSYSSSLSPLDSKAEMITNKAVFLFLTIFFIYTTMNTIHSIEQSMKFFTFNGSFLIIVTILIFFMIPIIENCQSPESPLQSSF